MRKNRIFHVSSICLLISLGLYLFSSIEAKTFSPLHSLQTSRLLMPLMPWDAIGGCGVTTLTPAERDSLIAELHDTTAANTIESIAALDCLGSTQDSSLFDAIVWNWVNDKRNDVLDVIPGVFSFLGNPRAFGRLIEGVGDANHRTSEFRQLCAVNIGFLMEDCDFRLRRPYDRTLVLQTLMTHGNRVFESDSLVRYNAIDGLSICAWKTDADVITFLKAVENDAGEIRSNRDLAKDAYGLIEAHDPPDPASVKDKSTNPGVKKTLASRGLPIAPGQTIQLGKNGAASITIVNPRGTVVARYLNVPGQVFRWDGRTANGRAAATARYFARIRPM